MEINQYCKNAGKLIINIWISKLFNKLNAYR